MRIIRMEPGNTDFYSALASGEGSAIASASLGATGDIPFDTERKPDRIILNPGTPEERVISGEDLVKVMTGKEAPPRIPIRGRDFGDGIGPPPSAVSPALRPRPLARSDSAEGTDMGMQELPPSTSLAAGQKYPDWMTSQLCDALEKCGGLPAVLDWIKSQQVQKPEFEVSFDTEAGTMISRYHLVEEVRDPLPQLVLMYDTRYDGAIFIPKPDARRRIRISVRSGNETRVYNTVFLGFGFEDIRENRRYILLLIVDGE